MKKLLLTILFCLFYSNAQGAIAVDATAEKDYEATAASTSWSHTCTGSNLILVVHMGTYDANIGERTVSSITYDSVALTLAETADVGSGERCETWYLINPSTGANTIAVTMGGTCTVIWGSSISFTGADQSTQPDASNSGTPTAVDPGTLTITTANDNAYVTSVGQTVSATISAIGGDQTGIHYYNAAGLPSFIVSSYSGPKTPAGAVSHTYTSGGGSDNFSLTGMSVKPYVAPTGDIFRLVSLRKYGATAPANDYTQDANCEAAWLMEADVDPVTDSSANSLDGDHRGDPTHSSASPPASFSTGYYVSDGTDDSFKSESTHANMTAGTMVIWYNDNGSDDWDRMIGHSPSQHDPRWAQEIGIRDTGVAYGIFTDTGNQYGTVVGTTDITTGAWFHLALSWTHGSKPILYVDGIPEGTASDDYKFNVQATKYFYAGMMDDSGSDPACDFDEALLFSRVLSQAEIQEIMTYGADGG